MTAIMASTVGVKTMADDTLRLTIDIDPQYAHEAFALFGKRGSPCAIARLTNESAVDAMRETSSVSQEVSPKSSQGLPPKTGDTPKGGALARLAGMWCNDHRFWEWINEGGRSPYRIGSSEDAAAWVRWQCSVESRAELDASDISAQRFHECVRVPYSQYLRSVEPMAREAA